MGGATMTIEEATFNYEEAYKIAKDAIRGRKAALKQLRDAEKEDYERLKAENPRSPQ
jgi:hypothetical protein